MNNILTITQYTLFIINERSLILNCYSKRNIYENL